MLYSIFARCPRSAYAMSRTSSGVMCRRSARGCTVIPGAPAATHTSTASSTLGTRPPREFRSVATLLTFTESRVIAVPRSRFAARRSNEERRTTHHERYSPEMLLDDVDDFLRPDADLVLMPAFEHHAQERLG